GADGCAERRRVESRGESARTQAACGGAGFVRLRCGYSEAIVLAHGVGWDPKEGAPTGPVLCDLRVIVQNRIRRLQACPPRLRFDRLIAPFPWLIAAIELSAGGAFPGRAWAATPYTMANTEGR